MTTGLGIFLIIYGGYSFVRHTFVQRTVQAHLRGKYWSLPVGFAAGTIGSAYNFNGVPVVVYGTLNRWKPERLHGTLQAHFLISGIFVVAGQALGGLWTPHLFKLYAYSLPAILIATGLGIILNRLMPAGKFERYVFLLIIVLGILLLVNPPNY